MTRAVRIRVRGQVQGVGFRPFVWQLADRFDICGDVCNDPEGVLAHATGEAIDAFLAALKTEAPPLARIDALEVSPHVFSRAPTRFDIVASVGEGAETRVTPDAATCDACLAGIRSEDPRRKHYAFTNCTHCGPRFTILRGLPYDRAKTTMAAFDMCDDCAAEYNDPADRRFHAQPVACAQCGPSLWFEDADGRQDNAIAKAAQRLEAGDILAIKGLGGFHLCCDATNADAVARLRIRKHRPSKPLALMGHEAHIRRYARVAPAEWDLLKGPVAPIVLLRQAAPLPDNVAPGQMKLGWMLPYTPLHHVLLDAFDRPLVMTSGNLSGEPQVIGNEEARDKLAEIVDGYLIHNRDIARRLDDSVMQITPAGPMVLRRARGQVPDTLTLPDGFADTPQTVAFGAHLKSAICLIKNGQALLSHHLGDLDDALTWDEFVKADADYADLFDHRPDVFACDLHPGYRSSQHAAARADGPLIEVQHHHAHLAACLAENNWPLDAGPVAGIVLDGLGLGDDGTIWGGELLLGDYFGFERRAWLTPAPLIGGDAASKEPWRNALARLDQAELSDWADILFPDAPRDIARMASDKGMNAPMSSSAGRLFDAVSTVLGLCAHRQSFEGEAAMALEAVAIDDGIIPMQFGRSGRMIDPAPMFRTLHAAVTQGQSVDRMAAQFHVGLARAFAEPALELVQSGEAEAIALSGGCFQNARLLAEALSACQDVPVLIHTRTPANDGSIALGQAVIAAAKATRQR